MNDAKINGAVAQHNLLLLNKNLRAIPTFHSLNSINRSHSFWKIILWSDESIPNRVDSDGKGNVWHPPNQLLYPKCTPKTVNYLKKKNPLKWRFMHDNDFKHASLLVNM